VLQDLRAEVVETAALELATHHLINALLVDMLIQLTQRGGPEATLEVRTLDFKVVDEVSQHRVLQNALWCQLVVSHRAFGFFVKNLLKAFLPEGVSHQVAVWVVDDVVAGLAGELFDKRGIREDFDIVASHDFRFIMKRQAANYSFRVLSMKTIKVLISQLKI
jgi:hypothetical protein